MTGDASAPPGASSLLRRAAPVLLFLLSGASSLVYEVSWTRRLVLLVGSTSTATALLLAAFMLGLALGARWGGPRADRSRNPLRLYAVLETLAAVAALALPWLLDGLGGWSALTASGREPLLFAAAFLVLLVPTTLLGATLPALTRAVIRDPARAGLGVGLLYGANTLGAVMGSVGAGFVLVERFGVDGSGRVGVVLNLVVAAAAFLLARGATVAAPETSSPETPAGGDAGPPRGVVLAATLAAFAGGFVGLASEVAWTRLLVFFLQGFTATFSAMLGAYLLGSALGGAWFGWRAGRTERPLRLLAHVLTAVAVLSGGALLLLHHQHEVVLFLRGAVAWSGTASANHKAVLLAASVLVLGPPAFALGGVFPVAVRAVAGGLGDLGARVGSLYAANTVGAVAGSLATGFLLVPLMGAAWTAALLAGVAALAAAVLQVASRRFEPQPEGTGGLGARAPWAVAVAVAAALVAAAEPGEPVILKSVVFQGPRGRENELLSWREGRTGTASVVRNLRNGYTSLYTDEFLAASTEGRYRYMRMLGHIPVVLARDPRRVLVMAFGTGTTAGSLSTHPSVERLDIVEISREVLAQAPMFSSVNRDVLERAGKPGRPEVRVFVEDARRFVLASPDDYDVITLEPLLPYTPGAVHLYTREFYELCRGRLSPGGAMCQWFPVHAMSRDDFAALAAAFVDVFPETSLWFVEETVALVGTNGPQGLPVKVAADRLSAPGPKEDLAAGRLEDLAQWWSFRMCGGAPLRRWLDDVAKSRGITAMTDEHPVIEFHPVPQGTLTTFLHDNLVVALDLREKEDLAASLDLTGIDPAEGEAFRRRVADAAAATAAYMDGRASEDVFGFHAGHTRLNLSDAERRVHETKAMDQLGTAIGRYAAALRINPADRIVADRWRSLETVRLLNEGRAHLVARRLAEAEAAYRDALELETPWNGDECWLGLARVLLADGRPVEAQSALDRAEAIYPRNRDLQGLRGQALVALGRPAEAAPWFERAYEGGSGPSDEDAAMRNARQAADAAASGDPSPDGDAPPVPPADPAEERRAALRAALRDADGEGRSRERAVEVLRAARERDPTTWNELLAPHRTVAMDGAADPVERLRALTVLAAAGDPALGEAALAVAKSATSDALAKAAADAAADGDGPAAAATVLALANGAPAVARARAATRLAGMKDRASVDAALAALDDPDREVRTAALVAVFQLTGEGKGFDPDAAEPDRRMEAAKLRQWWATARNGWKPR